MCNLCDSKTREAEQARLRDLASDLEDFAAIQLRLADGELEPHSADMRPIGVDARQLIRQLVIHWM